MQLVLPVTLLLSAAVGFVAAEEFKIDVTLPVECERKSQSGDKIDVHYRGTLASNGQVFDASYDRGQPLSFKLGGGQVIQGWDKGLLDMCIGEKRTLTIPPEFGYGQRDVGPIPAGATLIFETELMGISGVPKPEKIVTKAKEEASEAAETVSEAASDASESASSKVAEKVASAVSDAAEVVKTFVADADDMEEKNEL